MARVGVRELRQTASELLRRVAEGETFEITDRGHPVAVLSPVPGGSPLERLRATGLVEHPTEDVEDLPEPFPLPAGAEAPSADLARRRRDER